MESTGSYKKITVVLNKDGTARELAEKLKDEHGLLTGNIQSARGTGNPLSKSGFMLAIEKDFLTVVVPEDQADEIFEFIYEECGIGERIGGFMFQAHLDHSSEFTLPDLEEKP
jgi:hypothetical protein